MAVKALVQNLFRVDSAPPRSRRHSHSEKNQPRPVYHRGTEYVPPVPAVPPRPPSHRYERGRGVPPAPQISRPRSTPPAAHHHRRDSSNQHSRESSIPPNSEDRRPLRPVLKRNLTYEERQERSAAAQYHDPYHRVTFQNPQRSGGVHMHPILAVANRTTLAPAFYQVTKLPSPNSIVDRHTLQKLHLSTLREPATDPPTFTKLVLELDRLPWHWRAVVKPDPSIPRSKPDLITNMDVFVTVHRTLFVAVSQVEWDSLEKSSREQGRIAWENRCARLGGRREEGVLRVDCLGNRTKLVGVEVVKRAGTRGVPVALFSG